MVISQSWSVGRLVLVSGALWVVVGGSWLAVLWDLGFAVLVEWVEVVEGASDAAGVWLAFVVAEGLGVSSLPMETGSPSCVP